MTVVNKFIKLNNGSNIPAIGLGTWRLQNIEQLIIWAVETGYRLIDTASIYGNEKEIGNGVRNCGVKREELFVTTKVWPDEQGYKQTLAAIDNSLGRLKLDYVDLYLVHWPLSSKSKREETWKAMEEIYKTGKAKAVGVSNYTIELLKEMNEYAQIKPAVNQIELHPFWFRKELMNYCHEHNIALECYAPLARAKKLDDSRIIAIAKKYNKTNAQVALRWSLQHNNVVIPKTSHRERLQENIDVFDFEIAEKDMAVLDALNENYSIVSY